MKQCFKVLFIAVITGVFVLELLVPLQSAAAAGVVGDGTAASCTESAFDAALTVGGDIIFQCGPGQATITLTNEKTISKATSLDGGKRVTLNASSASRLFVISPKASLTLAQLTLAGGKAVDSDAAKKDGNGGSIWNQGGDLIMEDAMITASSAAHNGGAIFGEGGSVKLMRVTIFKNTAENGAAIYLKGGTADLGNVTFSANEAAEAGGAMYNDGASVIMAHNTLDFNKAPKPGAAIFTDENSNLTLENTIVANPLPTDGTKPIENCVGKILDGKTNLQYPDKTCGETIEVVAPRLAPLANYGGYPWTHALKSGSPAIDGADQAACVNNLIEHIDARRLNRPAGGACDIGAYEYMQALPTAIPPTAPPPPPQQQPGNPPPPSTKKPCTAPCRPIIIIHIDPTPKPPR